MLHSVPAPTAYYDYKKTIIEYLASLGLNKNDIELDGKTPLYYCKERDIKCLTELRAKY